MEKQLTLAEQGKEAGMKSAFNHANAIDPTWSDMAMEALKQFLANTNEDFMAEDVRKFAFDHGLPIPPSERAWGAVIRRASIAGLIKFFGYAKTENPKAHRTPAALWIRAKR